MKNNLKHVYLTDVDMQILAKNLYKHTTDIFIFKCINVRERIFLSQLYVLIGFFFLIGKYFGCYFFRFCLSLVYYFTISYVYYL